MYGEVKALLDQAGVVVERSLVGSYVTSLDMAGCALTLVRADEEVLRLVGRTGEDGGADVDGGGQVSTVLDARGGTPSGSAWLLSWSPPMSGS